MKVQRKYHVGDKSLIIETLGMMPPITTLVYQSIDAYYEEGLIFLVRIGADIDYEFGQFLYNQELVCKWVISWMKMKMTMENEMKEIVVKYIYYLRSPIIVPGFACFFL
jgi:hypothetical protein